MNTRTPYTTLALFASLCASMPAHAQSKGDWLIRAGVTQVNPKVTSGDLSAPSLPQTRIDVSGDTVLGGGITYMVSDHLAVDLPLAMFLKNKIKGDGAIKGSGEIGTTWTIPATLFAQYHFGEANATWRPYVGAGPTYAKFFGTTGNATLTGLTNPGGEATTLKIKDKFGLTVQAGLSYAIKPGWFFDAMVAKTKLKTTSTLSTGQTIGVTLDPVTYGLYVGHRF